MWKKIKYIIIFFSLITVIIGLVKVNIINTKALSPLGNSKENYAKVEDSFGDELSQFINDNSLIKIYPDGDKENGILVRVGKYDFRIKKQSYIVEKFEEAAENISGIYDNFFKVLIE